MSQTGTLDTTLSRGGSRGSVTVGDYLGTQAALAARAVRRLGLRPGLDRQLGGEPQTIGLVVAQEPDPGSDVPRGAMVTLYVSAPSASLQEHELAAEQPSDSVDQAAPPLVAANENTHPRRERRRRKRRPQPHAPAEEPPPPATPLEPPAPPPAPDPQERARAYVSEVQQTAEPEVGDPAWDRLDLTMRDVFQTGALGASARSIYPRAPLRLRARSWRSWLIAHRAIVALACGVVALSLAVTVRQKEVAKRPGGLATRTPPAAVRHPGASAIAVGDSNRRREPYHPARAPRRAPAAKRPSRPDRGLVMRSARATENTAANASVGAGAQDPPQSAPAGSAPPGQSWGGPFSP